MVSFYTVLHTFRGECTQHKQEHKKGHKHMKVVYDRRSNQDRRTNKNNKESFPVADSKGEIIEEERRVFGDRRKMEGLELSTNDINDDEFAEVFKQFQKEDPSPENSEHNNPGQSSEKIEFIDYQVLYRKGVECAYITLLKTDDQNNEPTLYAFREENDEADSQIENTPLHVQNIFGSDAYDSYIEQGWHDISKSENIFPFALKAWLAQNMKQDTIESRKKF